MTLLTTGVDSFPSSTRRVADGKKHLTCFIFRSLDLTIAKRTGIGTSFEIASGRQQPYECTIFQNS
ncbi:MAG: hypothetical protein H0X15_12450 [Acidobacteria bacterium]|nr:hypothetical protein [Acidobacteriota bacterium]